MNKKRAIILVFILATISLVIFYILPRDATTQAEAIRQAEQYQPRGMCGMAMTLATHTKTGAKYTFSSTCVAPGWVPDDTSQLSTY